MRIATLPDSEQIQLKPSVEKISASRTSSSPPKGSTGVKSDDSDKCVVIAEKWLKTGGWIGHVKNGGGSVTFDKPGTKEPTFVSERYIVSGEYTLKQIVMHGSQPKSQSWNRTKTKVETKTVIKEVDKSPINKEEYKETEVREV